MDALMMSRLQFAVATFFHFIFVPLTLGLSFLVAIMETQYVRTGDEEYKRMAKFWGKIFILNFVLGVVTGITLEFQFGTNWAGYSKYVGDIFGSILAIEATLTFFLESTMIGVWHFGWKKLSARGHAVCIWLVALAGSMSAYWILVANAWMQSPVGYVIRQGRAELTDFWAVITQPFAILSVIHVLSAAFVLAGFFVMGVSAYHILRKQNLTFFKRSFRLWLVFALIFSIVTVVGGDLHGRSMSATQPTKLAAVEAQWETAKSVPFYMLVIPSESQERNIVEWFGLPKMMSWLAHSDWNAEIRGLKSWPLEERPPVTLVFWSFRFMVGLGFLFVILMLVGLFKRNKLEESRGFLHLMVWAIPLPYIAASLGWTVTEVGRQPWIVYGVMKTSDAVSRIPDYQVGISLTAFIVVYSILGVICFYLIRKFAIQGPPPVPAATR